jgi:hypothetical protein
MKCPGGLYNESNDYVRVRSGCYLEDMLWYYFSLHKIRCLDLLNQRVVETSIDSRNGRRSKNRQLAEYKPSQTIAHRAKRSRRFAKQKRIGRWVNDTVASTNASMVRSIAAVISQVLKWRFHLKKPTCVPMESFTFNGENRRNLFR